METVVRETTVSRIAMLSVHGCPLARLGTREAGGMQLYVRALSRELGKRGHVVDVFTRRADPSLARIVSFGRNVRVVHLDAGPAAPVDKASLYDYLPSFVAEVERFRRREGIEYDLVHSHYWLSGWVGNVLARRWDAPHVTMFHTLSRLKDLAPTEAGESADRSEVETRIVAAADRIIASSEHERESLVDLYGARRDRVCVVPGGVDLNLFVPRDQHVARARLQLDGDVVLFVGRMDPIKGLEVLLRAFALLKHRSPATLVVVGGSAGEPELVRSHGLAATLGLLDRVQFRGPVPQEELPFYYTAATLLVVPSYYESFGLAAVEALACGTPVVGSMVGGLPTIVHEGANGFLVRSRQPAEYAERIESILGDPALRTHLASRARTSVARFGWNAVADRIGAIYGELASAAAPAVACGPHA
jgi:D-inositol-3-phosphate glycosyltransferase